MEKPVSLSEFFNKRVFRVPDYQRGYAWQKEQCADLWDDLVNIPKSKKHYTGMVAIQAVEMISDAGQWLVDELYYKPYYVVDGQQRLTTMIILINEIVAYARKHDYHAIGELSLDEVIGQYLYKTRRNGNIKGFVFSYENRDANSEYLENALQESTVWDVQKDTFYVRNLKSAEEFFRENIEAFCGQKESEQADNLNDLFNKLVNFMTFNVYEIDNQEDVFIIFETMNNRGKRLSNLELLKNRLIYLSTLVDDYDEIGKKSLRSKINDAWAEIYRQLGSNPERSLSDDGFLRDHWIMYFNYSRSKGNIYISDLLNRFSHKKLFNQVAVEHITKDVLYDDSIEDNEEPRFFVLEEQGTEEELSAKYIEGYVASLKDVAKYWSTTFCPENSSFISDTVKHAISQMIHLGMGYFRPLITAILTRYSNSSNNDQLIIDTIAAMERFSFIYFTLGHNNASGYNSDFYKMARYIYFGKDANGKLFGIDRVLERLKAVTEENKAYCLEAFANRIGKYFKDGRGYYDWKGKYYFFYEYECKKRGDKESKIMWEKYYNSKDDSIEHILPQTSESSAKKALAEDIQYWNDRFGRFSEKERNTLTGSIGNLLALSKSVNSSLQNHSYPKKRNPGRKERDRGYYNGSYSEIEVAENNNDWTAERIKGRSKQLLGFMCERWRVEFSEDQLKKLLPLDFVKDYEA